MIGGRRGAVLIIVLATLSLLALLAVSFATLQGIEGRITAYHVDRVRAIAAAESGIQMAIDRLQRLADEGWYPSISGGGSGTSRGTGQGPAARPWFYGGMIRDPAGLYDIEARDTHPETGARLTPEERAQLLAPPLDQALRPSFYSGQEITIEGRRIGISGIVTRRRRSDLPAGIEFYSVRVLDSQGRINANDGAEAGPDHPVSQNTRRLLNLLGAQPGVGIPDLGDRLIGRRPPGGWRTKAEMLSAVDYDLEKFRRFRDLVTVHSWTNDQVHNPVPLSQAEESVYPVRYPRPRDPFGKPIFRYGHGKNRMGDGGVWGTPGIREYKISGDLRKGRIYRIPEYGSIHPARGAIDSADAPWPLRFYHPSMEAGWPDTGTPWQAAVWSMDALHPQWIEQVARSPVNVNSAPREVLTALVTDLEGFFLLPRRFPNPPDLSYGFLAHRYYYDPQYCLEDPLDPGGPSSLTLPTGAGNPPIHVGRANIKHSELGHLVRTVPFSGPGGRNPVDPSVTIPAARIVEEILACREGRPSPNVAGFDYGRAAFGGPFRTWAQFYRFVDFLVERGVIQDRRPGLFFDYLPETRVRNLVYATPTGNQLVGHAWQQAMPMKKTADSAVQRRMAAQAAGDVLKANFNPNLHLNELNPDRALRQHVDKTDLIVNSTEFCFVPMGCFEIESLGMSVAATGREDDALQARDNRVLSSHRVSATVRLYDAKHVTLQKDFYRGSFGERRSPVPTNNNRATESGPEPDNGPAPAECAWDGYVTLATTGGDAHERPPSWEKPKGELWTTCSKPEPYPGAKPSEPGKPHRGSMIHAHMTYDHVAHHHAAGKCLPLGPDVNGAGSFEPRRLKAFEIEEQDPVPAPPPKPEPGKPPPPVPPPQDPRTDPEFRNRLKAKALSMAGEDAYLFGYQKLDVPDALMERHVTRHYESRAKNKETRYLSGEFLASFDHWTFALMIRWMDEIWAAEQPPPGPDYSAWKPIDRGDRRTLMDFHVWVEATMPAVSGVEPSKNFPDRTETISGPYSPVMSDGRTGPGKYRLGGTYRLEGTRPPVRQRYAVSDLRLDGAYVEPHSAFGYDLREAKLGKGFVACFWYKPNFFPECTTRLRTLLSLADFHEPHRTGDYGIPFLSSPLPFGLFFLPNYHGIEGTPAYGDAARPVSLLWAVGIDRTRTKSGTGGGMALLSPRLNHEFRQSGMGAGETYAEAEEDDDRFHGGDAGDRQPNHLRAHEWHHIAVAVAPGKGPAASDPRGSWSNPGTDLMEMWINGRRVEGTIPHFVHMVDGPADYSEIHGDSIRIGGEFSEAGVRDSRGRPVPANGHLLERDPDGRYRVISTSAPRLYFGDGTFDEFYLWGNVDFREGKPFDEVTTMFGMGRFYRPVDGDSDDGLYVSPEIELPPGARPLAMAWTAIAEDLVEADYPGGRKRLEPFFRDYQTLPENQPPAKLAIRPTRDRNGSDYPTACEMHLLAGGRQIGPFHDEGWSPIRPGDGDLSRIRFRAKFRVGESVPGAVLLAAPVLDDVTIFYRAGPARFLSYAEVPE